MVSPIVQSQLHHIETFFMVFYRVAGITITLSTLKTVCKLIKLNEVVRSRISLFDLILQTSLECNLAVFRRMQPPFFLYHGLFEQWKSTICVYLNMTHIFVVPAICCCCSRDFREHQLADDVVNWEIRYFYVSIFVLAVNCWFLLLLLFMFCFVSVFGDHNVCFFVHVHFYHATARCVFSVVVVVLFFDSLTMIAYNFSVWYMVTVAESTNNLNSLTNDM